MSPLGELALVGLVGLLLLCAREALRLLRPIAAAAARWDVSETARVQCEAARRERRSGLRVAPIDMAERPATMTSRDDDVA